MRIKLLIGTALAVAGLLAGCGGGGSKTSSQSGSIRTLMGYVYVKDASNVNATDPDVIITPASTPPAEPHKYNIPTAGKITLIAENGTFLQKVSSGYTGAVFTKDLSTGNDIIVNVQLDPGGKVNVAGSNITSGTETKNLVPFETTVNDGKPSGTTALLRSPNDPETRTPDPTAISEVKFTLDGVAPQDPNEIIAGDRKFLGIGYIDVNGLAVPGVPSIGNGVTISSSAPAKVQVNKTDNILTTAVKGQTAGDVTIHVSVNSPSSASGDLVLNYNFGEPANLAIYRKSTAGLTRIDIAQIEPIVMRWNVATNPRASSTPTYLTFVAEVTNKYGAAIPDLQVNWSNAKVSNANIWKTSAGGYAFVDPDDEDVPAQTTTTDTNGQTVVRFKAPEPIDGPLGGTPGDANGVDGDGDQLVKAMNYVFATVNGTSVKNKYPAKVFLTRQFNNVVIAEAQVSKYMIVNAYSRVPYTSYATDVDGWECRESFVVNWKAFNVQGGDKVGDPGEEDLIANIRPTSECYFEGATLVTGTKAGEVEIQAVTPDTLDPVASSKYKVEVWGPPKQIMCGPGPAEPSADRPWEFYKIPTAVRPFGLPPSELTGDHFEPNGDTPPKYVAYLYLFTTDSWGFKWVTVMGQLRKRYRLTAIPATIPEGGSFSATYSAPLNYGSISTPDTPLGDAGARPLIVVWGPFNGSNGEITINYSGTWYGANTDAPRPTAPVPFSVTRKIRVYNGGG